MALCTTAFASTVLTAKKCWTQGPLLSMRTIYIVNHAMGRVILISVTHYMFAFLLRKNFGPKGYGYGGGAGTLSMDGGSITKPERSVTPDKKIQVAATPSKLSPGG